VPDAPLASVWAGWQVLKNGFIDKQKLDPAKMSQGAVNAMLKGLDPAALPPGSLPPAMAKPPRQVPTELRPLWDAWASINENYTGKQPLNTVKLGQVATAGFVAALDDPHTEYIEPEQFKSWSQDFYGNYGGIGAEVHSQGGKFILSPMPGSPAEAAGIKPGDVLVAVEGQSVQDWTLLHAISLIRGQKGTPVRLSILHLGAEAPVELTVVRDTIKLQSVFWNMTNDQFAYIRVSSFYENTPPDLVRTILEAREKGARGIILDLRNNPGGFLRAAVDIASQFIGNEKLAVYEMNGSGKRTDWKGRDKGIAADLPMVVLVNQYSASASEVVAGALQDHGRAKLIGVTTWGKGSVNLFEEMPDGGGLYYTYARWYTPSGRMIEGKGLDPDEQVVASSGGRAGDNQLEHAIVALKSQMGIPAASAR
jgi:carboxyl-terminal processing protease